MKILAYAMIAVMGLFMYPYLLWLAWGRILSLKRAGKPSDFDCRGTK